jgi:hypothetical protein
MKSCGMQIRQRSVVFITQFSPRWSVRSPDHEADNETLFLFLARCKSNNEMLLSIFRCNTIFITLTLTRSERMTRMHILTVYYFIMMVWYHEVLRDARLTTRCCSDDSIWLNVIYPVLYFMKLTTRCCCYCSIWPSIVWFLSIQWICTTHEMWVWHWVCHCTSNWFNVIWLLSPYYGHEFLARCKTNNEMLLPVLRLIQYCYV